jgi:hypothetical protein
MTNRDTVRQLNDAFRQTFLGGRVTVTASLAERPDLDDILRRVQLFSDFNEANDPWHEHDFAAFDHGNDKMFFKIDYYDLTLTNGSPDPADASVTTRVMTIMLASEY